MIRQDGLHNDTNLKLKKKLLNTFMKKSLENSLCRLDFCPSTIFFFRNNFLWLYKMQSNKKAKIKK